MNDTLLAYYHFAHELFLIRSLLLSPQKESNDNSAWSVIKVFDVNQLPYPNNETRKLLVKLEEMELVKPKDIFYISENTGYEEDEEEESRETTHKKEAGNAVYIDIEIQTKPLKKRLHDRMQLLMDEAKNDSHQMTPRLQAETVLRVINRKSTDLGKLTIEIGYQDFDQKLISSINLPLMLLYLTTHKDFSEESIQLNSKNFWKATRGDKPLDITKLKFEVTIAKQIIVKSFYEIDLEKCEIRFTNIPSDLEKVRKFKRENEAYRLFDYFFTHRTDKASHENLVRHVRNSYIEKTDIDWENDAKEIVHRIRDEVLGTKVNGPTDILKNRKGVISLKK